MKRRTQLYLDEGQYRWLRQQAGPRGSIAGVVRDLIEDARTRRSSPERDPLIGFLLEEVPADGNGSTSVETLDHDVYG